MWLQGDCWRGSHQSPWAKSLSYITHRHYLSWVEHFSLYCISLEECTSPPPFNSQQTHPVELPIFRGVGCGHLEPSVWTALKGFSGVMGRYRDALSYVALGWGSFLPLYTWPVLLFLCRYPLSQGHILVCLSPVNSVGLTLMRPCHTTKVCGHLVGGNWPWYTLRLLLHVLRPSAGSEVLSLNMYQSENYLSILGDSLRASLTQLMYTQKFYQWLNITGSWLVEMDLRVPWAFCCPAPMIGTGGNQPWWAAWPLPFTPRPSRGSHKLYITL